MVMLIVVDNMLEKCSERTGTTIQIRNNESRM